MARREVVSRPTDLLVVAGRSKAIACLPFLRCVPDHDRKRQQIRMPRDHVRSMYKTAMFVEVMIISAAHALQITVSLMKK